MPMLHLGRLTTFREVLQRQSFSAAADALGYTQSSVSQQVSVLEQELGATLIDRAVRPLRATPAGEVVLSHTDLLLGEAAAVARDLAALKDGDAGTLRIGGFFSAWATFMPEAVASFSSARPRVDLELRQLEPGPCLSALRSGELDVGVIYRYPGPPPDEQRFRWTKLLDDHYAVALPAGHPQAAADAVDLASLASERWVSPPPGVPYTELLRRLCEEHGFSPEIGFQTNDIAMAQPLVAAGLAVALLPALGLVPRHRNVAVRPLTIAAPARSVWAAEVRHRRTPAAAALLPPLIRAAEATRR